MAVLAALLAAAMAAVYVGVMHHQGDQPLAWVLTLLIVGALLAGYGSQQHALYRREAVLVAGGLLTLLGLLAILSIGLPIIAAGVLALVSGLGSRGTDLHSRPGPSRAGRRTAHKA